MADDKIREGEPDQRHGRDLTDRDVGGDASVPDIRKHPREIEFVDQYHKQMVALGALWILVFGVPPCLLTYMFATGSGLPQSEPLAVFLVAFALVWITLGVLACMKYILAVRAGLVLNYLTVIILIVSLFRGETLAGCGFLSKGAFLALSILQALRVIRLSKKMRSAGIPLDHKPE